jgi:hypothetical protein
MRLPPDCPIIASAISLGAPSLDSFIACEYRSRVVDDLAWRSHPVVSNNFKGHIAPELGNPNTDDRHLAAAVLLVILPLRRLRNRH